jgi:hypothetical protein
MESTPMFSVTGTVKLCVVSVAMWLVCPITFADNLTPQQQQYQRDLEVYKKQQSAPDPRPKKTFKAKEPWRLPTLDVDTRCGEVLFANTWKDNKKC